MLVAGMEHDDPAIRLASLKALRKITGKDLGVDAAAVAEDPSSQARGSTAAGDAAKPRRSPSPPDAPPAGPAIDHRCRRRRAR